MSTSIYVKPAVAGAIVRNPHRSFAPLPAEGDLVPYGDWVIRRLRDGEVVQVKPPAADKPAASEKPKK